MYPSFLVIFSFAMLSAVSTEEQTEKYTTKFDNVDLNDIVKNERLLKNYVECMLERGRCTPDGQELKKNIPDAIATDCSKCSEKQKTGSNFMIHYLIDNKPELWKELEDKYDPQGTYKQKYLESSHIPTNPTPE